MAKYISGRQKNFKIGVSSFSENLTSLEVIGKVGIGTTNATTSLTVIGDVKVAGVITANSFSGDGSQLSNLPSSNYSPNAGVATYAVNAGITTNLKGGSGGSIPYQISADTTSFIVNGPSGYVLQSNGGTNIPTWEAAAPSNAITGLTIREEGFIVGSANSISQLDFVGPNITATASGNISTVTVADYVSNAGVATGLTTTSNVNTSGIITAASFSGSGVNLTSLNASNLSSGVVPSDRITASSGDFTVGNDLYVNGNLSIGGTSVILNAATLVINDKDIVVGYTTDINGNDVSNDVTANHGGISVASTVGSPIINIPLQVGVNSRPSTYKQIMWIKEGNYSGMGTDAWVFNYAVSIGNTSSVKNNSRLTVGTGFTVFDNYVELIDIRSRNIFSSGIITASSFDGNSTTATYASNAGVATYASNAGISTSVIGGISSVSQLRVSGISTLGFVTATSLYSVGVITASSFVPSSGFIKAPDGTNSFYIYGGTGNVAFQGTIGASKINNASGYLAIDFSSSTTPTVLVPNNLGVTGIVTVSDKLGIGTTDPTSKIHVIGDGLFTGIITANSFSGNATSANYAQNAGVATYASNSGVATYASTAGVATGLTTTSSVNTTGIITALRFIGDGSQLTGLVAPSSGIGINSDGISVGVAATILNFSSGILVTPISSGIATISVITGNYASNAGVATYADSSGISTYASTAGVATYASNAGVATYASTSGIATYASTAGVATYTPNAGIATYADSSGISTYAPNAGVATYATSAGIATYAPNAGVATYASTSGIATYASTAGVATYTPNAGIATYTPNAGVATYASTSGIATYATSAGVATYASTSGIATYATSAGIATYAPNAGLSTALKNSRTFEITGDIVASPVSFDGTGNVSLAATIQPNSVALGGDTTGDYIQSISGTANQITVTGGTGEGSTPVISIPSNPTLPGNVTIANDLQVNNNLNVTGNITVGGTTGYLIVQDFKVSDADIIVGFTTDAFGQDVSTDTTANHGGIAVASTEGSPLVDLVNVAIGEINPTTYKKIMWFKSGAFAGLNTDAWLFNYGVGIGSTQFPSGTRLAAGSVQFTENDLAVVRNINASGISTLGSVQISSGIVTATSGVVTYYGDGSKLTGITVESLGAISGITVREENSIVGTAGSISSINFVGPNVTATAAGSEATITIADYVSLSGVSTYASTAGVATYAPNAGVATYSDTAGVSTRVSGGTASITQLSVSGVSTVGLLTATNIGIGTDNASSPLYVVGDTFITGILTANRIFSNVYGEFTGGGITGTDIVGTALSISGISTFSSGPVLIGSVAQTGTVSQLLQVTGGAYISTSTGIGITNPSQLLHVEGNARISGAIYDSTNSAGISGQVLQSTETGTQWTTPASGGGSGIAAKFDTNIDNVFYVTPTGTLDRVGVGTTTTQITSFPSTSGLDYIVHSIHVTNISNGDAEITAAFDLDALKVPAVVSAGTSGIHTCRVSSASSITVGMAFTGTNVDFNTLVTDVSGTVIFLSKPLLGPMSGTGFFTPVSKVVSRLPVPVGSAVEIMKQPFVLYPSDSVRVQATGLGTVGVALSTTASAPVGFATIGVSTFSGIAAGQLVVGSGIATNTYVGVGYTPGTLVVPITKAVRSALSATPVQFIDAIVPQDGSLQTTIVYQATTDTAYLNGSSRGVGVGTTATVYYGTGNTYPSVVQSIRVSNISDSGDYPVWVGIGNSDTIFTYLAYNLIVPKNSTIELCEAPKRLGIGQSIFAFSDTLNSIEIQIAGKQKIQ